MLAMFLEMLFRFRRRDASESASVPGVPMKTGNYFWNDWTSL